MLRFFLRSKNKRQLRKYTKNVELINALEPQIQQLSDEDLKAKTLEFREKIAQGKTLNDLLVEAFACTREAARRVMGKRHYDVQLIGGMVMHEGKIAEMQTGEGKTLVATLAAYLNALGGQGVHVVTVNDYLASRDAALMGEVFAFMGLKTGCITGNMPDEERRQAYEADITYGTNNEFGFDYLRDNMKHSLDEMVQRSHAFALIDEVDSILVDEARTPLIISGPTDDKSELYHAVDKLIPLLEEEHYELDEKNKSVFLTENGNEFIEKVAHEKGLTSGGGLYDIQNITLVHHIHNALRAHKLFRRDRDYIVRDNKLILIDEFTGRMMDGRRYSEGLHQALEAKEDVEIQPENQTLASITFQNYFRTYRKIGGMTGTASTEADEFMEIYNLQVISIPTNRPVVRIDEADAIYRTAQEKFEAIVEEVKECVARKQPVLIGTTSIEKSELLSSMLEAANIRHNVLNARYHEQEAHIIAEAGVPGTVTIATNMAGRGTDIQLGGNLEMRLSDVLVDVQDDEEKKRKEKIIEEEIEEKRKIALEAGGLYVMGTERHESRRIDNQLRGRSGRQGDPGHSKFYLSLEDDLMRIFGSGKLDFILRKMGLKHGEAISHPIVSKALEKAQYRVETQNFDIRKNILKYDDVMNDQRKVIFENRLDLMQQDDMSDMIEEFRKDILANYAKDFMPPNTYPEQWHLEEMEKEVKETFNIAPPLKSWFEEEGIDQEVVIARLNQHAQEALERNRRGILDPQVLRQAEHAIVLHAMDTLWREHISILEHLRQAVSLRAYGQRDPLNEYKSEALELFQRLLENLRIEVVRQTMHLAVIVEEDNIPSNDLPPMHPHHIDPLTGRDEFFNKDETSLQNASFKEAAFKDGAFEDASFIHQNLSSTELDAQLPDYKAFYTPIEQLEMEHSLTRDSQDDSGSFDRVGRNAPCPCGSGKKYKHCHGQPR